jgi:peptidoglycan/xylan/chitin deacetylase (PgdA/CDA1 family)
MFPAMRTRIAAIVAACLLVAGGFGIAAWRGMFTAKPALVAKAAPPKPKSPPPPPPKFPSPMFTFTFDDGWAGQPEAGALLLTHGWRGTFYIVPSWLGLPSFMTSDEVKALAKAGHEIGAHTMTHPQLQHIPKDASFQEIGAAQSWLTNFLDGTAVVSFAPPFGLVDKDVTDIVAKLFTSDRSGPCAVASPATDPNALPNCVVETGIKNAKGPQVEYIKSLITKAKQQTGWVIVVFHHITPNGTQKNDEDPADFAGIVDAVAASGVRVVTIAEGAAMIRRYQAGAPTDVTNPYVGDHGPY